MITKEQSKAAILGAISFNLLSKIIISVILFTPAFSYYMAVHYSEEPPFPHATITNTACHYPQDIVFRLTMTANAAYLVLLYFVMFRWLEKKAKQIEYPGNIYSYMYWPSIISVFGYLIAMATVDGKGTGSAHSIGAVFFFIILYVMVVNITFLCINMRNWDSSFMTKRSLFLKKIVNTYFNLMWGYMVITAILQSLGMTQENSDDKYVVIAQWNLVYGGLIWILCFMGDWKKLKISFVKVP